MRRVAVLAPEPIRPKMAGMGIRALELARALRPEHDVRLLVPNSEEEARAVAGEVPVASVGSRGLRSAAEGADAAVVSGHAASAWFQEMSGVPVAADLYDPFPIENLHYAPALGPDPARHDRETLALALARADFFLCASPEQRLFYAGALYAAGRIGPANFPSDPSLETLLAVVPFGVPSEPASGDRARGRAALGLPADGPLVLFGGIYDWYDPRPLLEAWSDVLAREPSARLLFFENPNPETTPQRAFARAKALAAEIDPGGRSIVFAPWRPYVDRADLYAASDVCVSIAARGLESDLAFRTRLLDAAWGGVPSVSIEGGPLAAELERAGAGRRLSGGGAGALATAVLEVARAGTGPREAARRFAAERTWSRVAAPVAAWCRRARVDPGRGALEERAGRSLRDRLLSRR